MRRRAFDRSPPLGSQASVASASRTSSATFCTDLFALRASRTSSGAPRVPRPGPAAPRRGRTPRHLPQVHDPRHRRFQRQVQPELRHDPRRRVRTPGPTAPGSAAARCRAPAFSTNRPSTSLSPSTRAPASASNPSSGGVPRGSGSGSPISMGRPDQKGERHPSAPGSSQASSAHWPAASRSASVCTLSGRSASSKTGAAACAAQSLQ